MMSRIILFVLGWAIWIGLNWPPDGKRLAIGALIAALVSYITGDMFIEKRADLKNPARYLWFLYYIPLLIWECIKANIDVAYRVAHPGIPIRPGIVKVKTTLKSDTALTFLANSITLTPGTMSVDIDKDKGLMYIHWINVKGEDVESATRLIVEKFETILKRIFG